MDRAQQRCAAEWELVTNAVELDTSDLDRLRLLDHLELSGDSVWETDSEFRYTFFSDNALAGTGWKPADLIGRTPVEIGWEVVGEELSWEDLQRYIDAGEAFAGLEIRIPIAASGERIVSISGKPLHDDFSRFVGYRGVAQDVTSQKRTQMLLRINNSILERLARGEPLPEILKTIIETIELLVPGVVGAVRFLNVDSGKLEFAAASDIGQAMAEDMPEIFVDEDIGPCGIAMREARLEGVEDGGALSLGDPIKKRLDIFGVVSLWAQPILLASQEPVGVLNVFSADPYAPSGIDKAVLAALARVAGIAYERHQVGQALANSEIRFRDIAESTSDWFWETDTDSKICYVSGRVEEITGIPVAHFMGRRRDQFPGTGVEPEFWLSHIQDVAERKPFRDLTYPVVNPAGEERWFRISGKPAYDIDGQYVGYRGSGRDMTEEVEAQNRAQEAEHLMMDAIENSAEGLTLWDADHRFIVGNLSKLGHSERLPADDRLVPGMTFREYARIVAYAGLMPEADGREEEWFEERVENFERADGRPIIQERISGEWARVTDHKTRDGGRLSVYSDITSIMEREAEIRTAEERLTDAIESISQGFILYDADDRLILTNSKYREFFPELRDQLKPGTSFEAIVRAAAEKIFFEDVEDFTEKRIAWRRKPEEPYKVHRVGDRWLMNNERPTRAGGTVSVWTDITDLRERDEALMLSEQRFAMAFQTSAIMMAISSKDTGVLLEVNDHWLKTLGFRREEVIGNSAVELGIWADAGAREKLIDIIDRDGEAREIEAAIRTKSGDIIQVLNSCEVIDVGGEKRVLFVTHNISEQKRVEEQLRNARDQAEFASRTKSEFLANMSHELRTPLNAVIGFAEFIEREIYGSLGDERYKGYVSDIKSSGVHLLDLINDILDVSRVEAGRLELRETVIDVEDAVRSSARFIRDRAHQSEISVDLIFEPDLPQLYCDETKFKQILVNLLGNAVKFTERGGSISVRAKVSPQLGGVDVAVSDTGIGIEEADIEEILTVFGQVDSAVTRQYDGAGLGLPLTKALVELHGGKLRLESDVGVGTKVVVCFPPERSMPR